MKTIILILSCLLTITLSAQWNSLEGPYGGSINDYANEGTSSYVSTSSGLYRSEDNGTNWIHLNNNLPEFIEVHSFCVDRDELFLSFQDILTKQNNFVYSADKGDNWAYIPLPVSGEMTYNMTYRNGQLLATMENGLIESGDKGFNWTDSKLTTSAPYFTKVTSNHSYYFANDYSGPIYRRAINDTLWQIIFNPINESYLFHVSDSLIIIIPVDSQGFRSLDNGVHWEQINLSGESFSSQIAEFGNTLYYSTYEHIYKSIDRGLNWAIIRDHSFPNFYFWDMLRAGNSLMGNHYATGLLKSTDEFQTYESSVKGINSLSCDRMISTDSFLFVIGENSLGRYDFINKTWNEKPFVFNGAVTDLCYHKGVLFVLGTSNTLYISNDHGESFTFKKLDFYYNHGHIFPEILGFKDKVLIDGEEGVFASEDSGETWKHVEVRDFNTGDWINYTDVGKFQDQLFVISKDRSNNEYYLYKSDDAYTWNLVTEIFPNSQSDRSIGDFLSTHNHMFIIMWEAGICNLYRWDSLSLNFKACEGLPDLCYFNLQNRLVGAGNRMILNTEAGYYFSEDYGVQWNRVVDEISFQSSNRFSDMAIKDNNLYGCTYHLGVLKTELDALKSEIVSGFVYLDENHNAVYDGNDRPLTDAHVLFGRTSQYVPTNKSGIFRFLYTSAILDTLIPNYRNKYGVFDPPKKSFLPGDTSISFAYSIPTQIEDISVELINVSVARPGFKSYLDISLKNYGAHVCSAKLLLYPDSGFNYQNASVVPQFISSGLITWDVNLNLLENKSIRLEFLVADTIQLNSDFEFRAELQNLSCNDINLSDNADLLSGKIRASYDPNLIEVDKELITKMEVQDKIPLTYTIHFQNTGNYPAEVVRLINHLYYFDPLSLEVLEASHPFSYRIIDDQNLEVVFDMIHLADSLSDEANSHGYFRYRILPNPKNVANQIRNQASIYFDFNNPIHTNEAITKVVDVVSNQDLIFNKDQRIIVVPNPNHGEFRVFSPYFENNEITRVKIYDLQGHCIFERKEKIYDGYQLDLSGVEPGIYFLQIGSTSKLVCKIVITD